MGNFIAQLKYLKIRNKISNELTMTESFISQYERDSGQKIDKERLKIWIVIGLLELAVKQYRGLKRKWERRIGFLFDECESMLQAEN